MPVRLEQLPPAARLPDAPRTRRWAGFLVLSLAVAAAGLLLFARQAWHEIGLATWVTALVGAGLAWCMSLSARLVVHLWQQQVAHTWNAAREYALTERLDEARRYLSVLAVSFHTALRPPGEDGSGQLADLLEARAVIKTQPSHLGPVARHSRLQPASDGSPDDVLLDTLRSVLADLAKTLTLLPDETALTLIWDNDSGIGEVDLQRIWQRAWATSGIRQAAVPSQDRSLEAVDQWLDRRSDDCSLLLVMALRTACAEPEGTAEACVGLLLGNPDPQAALAPIANLHRPQQANGTSQSEWLQAAHQALDWVPLLKTAVAHAWVAGMTVQQSPLMTTILAELAFDPMVATTHLDSVLGNAGRASPWLAAACAAQHIQQGAAAQIIFAGDGHDAATFWGATLTPVVSSANQGEA